MNDAEDLLGWKLCGQCQYPGGLSVLLWP